MTVADDRRFLDVPGSPRLGLGADRAEVVVWCQGPVEQHASAVLLLHDRSSNARSWDLVMRRLPAGVAIVAVDLRGRGSAWRQMPSLGITSHLDDLIDVLDRLDIDDVLAVGHGFGAVVASELGRRAADRVACTIGVLTEVGDDPFGPVAGLAFPDRAEHLRFWQRHPRFSSADQRSIDAFVTHGIAGPEDHHRWRVDLRSLVADDRDRQAVSEVHFSRSIAIGSMSLAATTDRIGSPDRFGASTQLPHLDPATVLFTGDGADAIAAQIRMLLA